MVSQSTARAILLSGPNGAGKSTIAGSVLPRDVDFLNADILASSLRSKGTVLSPQGANIQAGRLIVQSVRDHVAARKSFAFENNLVASSLFAQVRSWQDAGYRTQLVYVMLGTPEMAIRRVEQRVRRGGHDVPKDVIIRRFWRSRRNFVQMIGLVDEWMLIDNSGVMPLWVANGAHVGSPNVQEPELWSDVHNFA